MGFKTTYLLITLAVLLCEGLQFDYKAFQFGTTKDFDETWGGITTDNNGNIYVGGTSEGSMYDDPTTTNQTFIGKYSPDYVLLSSTSWSDWEYSYPRMLLFHATTSTVFVCGSTGNEDHGFILALDSDTLQLKWEQRIGGNQSESLWAMAFDPSDTSAIFAVGATYSPEVLGMPAIGSVDGILLKLEVETGDFLLTLRFGHPETYTDISSIAVDSEGYLYVPMRVYNLNGSFQLEVSKLNPQGVALWTTILDSDGEDYSWSILESDGVVYGTLTSNGWFNPDCTSPFNGTSFADGLLVYAMETDSGDPKWCQNFRTVTDDDMGYWAGIFHQEDSNRLFVVGSAASDLMGATLNGPVSTWDVAILVLDLEGNLEGADLYGSSNIDFSNAGSFSQNSGELYVLGTTEGNIVGANQGPKDYFVLEMSIPSDYPKKQDNQIPIIVGSVLGGTALIAVVAGSAFFFRRRIGKKTQRDSHSDTENSIGLNAPSTDSHYTKVVPKQPLQEEEDTHYATSPGQSLETRTSGLTKHDLSGFNNDWIIDYAELQMGNKIGKGSFGVVLLARWRSSDVAVKQLIIEEEELGNMNMKITDFFAEAELMKKLRPHPNITRLLGVCIHPMCLVFEYVPNGSLASYLHSNKPLESSTKLDIIKGIAAGMLHLHSEGVIHRDLAARNILLDANLKPKVSDFGMSRVALDNKTNKTEADVGPIKWMAPEALTKRIYNTKTDVWSFGVVIYEVLSRQFPLKDYHVMEAATNIALGTLSVAPDLERLVIDHANDVNTVLMGSVGKLCLAFEPEQRIDFQSIMDRLEGNNPSE